MFSPYTYRHLKPSTTKFIQSNFRTSKFWTDMFLFLESWSVWLHCQDFVQDIWIINDYLLFLFWTEFFSIGIEQLLKDTVMINTNFIHGYIYPLLSNPSRFELTAFTHFLRGIIADSEDTIKAAADSLGRHGFINYFGLQVLPWWFLQLPAKLLADSGCWSSTIAILSISYMHTLVSNDLTYMLDCVLFSVLELVLCQHILLEPHCSEESGKLL